MKRINRKEYELLFRLNAQTGGTYNKTFSEAQKQISSMQKEIQSLNKIQSDITAYQKQQSSVNATTEKLRALQQQYDNIQKEIKETEGYSSSLENKLISKRQQIDSTSAALERQKNQLEETKDALHNAGISTDELASESANLKNKVTELQAEQEKIAESAQEYGTKGSEAFQAVGAALAAAGVTAGLKELYNDYMACINLAADFEETMSTVEALSGANARELNQLSNMAKDLGASTKFTANQSAEAMTYMGMAGWNAQQMLSGMDGVLKLAAASGEDLAMVSDIVTDNLTAFKLSAKDTAHFSDVLAAAATNSNTSVSIMGETFKNAASIAGALGYSIEDVAVATGLMANSGIKGSNAGTVLKNTFNGLLEGATLTSQAFGEYEYSSIRADGTTKGLKESIDELRYYFGQMTEAERVNNAMTIAGSRSYNGLLAILNATDEDYSSLTESINDCSGAAEKMAEIKLDNLNGQLTLMNSAWDALKTTIGEQFNPEFRELYSIGTDVFSALNEYVKEHPEVVKAVTAFIGVVGVATAGLTAYLAISKAIKALNIASMFTNPVTAVFGLVTAVTAVVAAMKAWSDAENDNKYEIEDLTYSSRKQYEELQNLQIEYNKISHEYGENSEKAAYLRWQIDELRQSYDENKQSLSEYLEECEKTREQTYELINANKESYTEIKNEETKALALTHRLQELSKQTEDTTARSEEMKAIIAELNEIVPDLNLSYEDAVSGVTDYGKAIENTIKANYELQKQQAAQKNASDFYTKWQENKKAVDEGLRDSVAKAAEIAKEEEELARRREALTQKWTTNNQQAYDEQNEKLEHLRESLSELDASVAESQIAESEAYRAYKEYLDEIVESTDSFVDSSAGQSAALCEIINGTIEKVGEVAKAYEEAYHAAYDSVTGQYKLWENAAEVESKSASSISESLSKQSSYWKDYNDNLKKLSDRSNDIEGLRDLLSTFADGSSDSVNAIAGMANASEKDLKDMVKNWQELQKQQDDVSTSIAQLKVDIPNYMDDIKKEFSTSIEEMDFTKEATASAHMLIQGFINGATERLPEVQQAYEYIANAAINSMSKVSGAKLSLTIPEEFHAYATGTQYAQQGFALVGEYGPELVYFNGGEQVLTAQETAAMRENMQVVAFAPELMAALSMRSAKAESVEARTSPTFSETPLQINFNIEGNATSETVAQLREYGDELRDFILETIQQNNTDTVRRAYV